MPIKDLPILTYFDVQRFKQLSPMDCANMYLVENPQAKKKSALYPSPGRKHVSVKNVNKLNFAQTPRAMFRSVKFIYVVVGSDVIRVDEKFNQKSIKGEFTKERGPVWFDYVTSNNRVRCVFTDGTDIFYYEEADGTALVRVTDTNKPSKPLYVAAFGSRIVVSQADSPQFYVTQIQLGGGTINKSTVFTIGGASLFAQADGAIKQLGVLHNQLYIFTDFTTNIWSNTSSSISTDTLVIPFPFRRNTSTNFDYGIADPKTLDIDFGIMVWLGKNRSGLVDVMVSNGGQPQPISTKAVDVLFENQCASGELSPFLEQNANGFLYQIESTVLYRISAGNFVDFGDLDAQDSANSIEYNFEAKRWHRCIELNGERSRVQRHVYLNNKHIVQIENDTSLYEMSERFYVNERRNINQSEVQADDAYITDPMRYELITPIISQDDYAEFITDWVQIDFVFGENETTRSDVPFSNTTYIIDEESGADGNPVYLTDENGDFLITEDSNTPTVADNTYYAHFRPHIELYYSDDGGIRFHPADVREFSDLGVYRWRMRWYELGTSRNRVYKLVCVSKSPIVVLGGIQSVREASGGAR
jgi:hypothetical protein